MTVTAASVMADEEGSLEIQQVECFERETANAQWRPVGEGTVLSLSGIDVAGAPRCRAAEMSDMWDDRASSRKRSAPYS